MYALAHITSYRWTRRESTKRQSRVDCLTTHQLQVARRLREVIFKPIKCMLSPTNQLQVESRERHRANQVDALATHQLQVESERES